MIVNFKIENKYLNITNYPFVGKYLESMASKGWLLSKIIAGSLFIFKKIEPQALDFSISPYQVETAFTRQSKESIDEFEGACESGGWNYCTRSYNLHIYSKEKDAEAVEIHTDQEAEFELLERIGKTQMRSHYFSIPFLLFITWITLGRVGTSVYSMKNGLDQMIASLLPMASILSVVDFVHIKRFLKVNRKNIELGEDVEYSDSKFYFTRLIFALTFFVGILFILYILYVSVFFKNKIIAFSFFPILASLLIGQLYRIFIKPSKHSKTYKKVAFGVMILVAVIISGGIGMVGILNVGHLANSGKTLDRNKYKVLLTSDFVGVTEEDETILLESTSPLVPKSYEHTSRGSYEDQIGSIETEYSRALTQRIAKELVNRYKAEAVKNIEKRYNSDLEFFYKTGRIDNYLLDRGLTIADFDELRQKDLKHAINESLEIIKQKAITEADPIFWGVDEAYFLTYYKEKILLRKGKDVFLLRGIDFSDTELVVIVKEKLGL